MRTLQKKIVGIDLHDYSVEIVQLTSKGKKLSLDAFNIVPLPEKLISNGEINDVEGVKSVLRDALKSANPGEINGKNVSLALPASKVLTHVFEMAGSLSDEDIRKSLPYEAENIIPFSFSDIYWGFTVLRKEGTNKTHGRQYVLFACINREIADKYSSLLEDVGLGATMFCINAEAVKSAIERQLKKDMTYLALDVGILSVDCMVVRNGVLLDYVSSTESGRKLMSEFTQDFGEKSSDEIYSKKEAKDFHNSKSIERAGNFLERCFNRGQQAILDFEARFPAVKVEGVILSGHFLRLPHFYALAKKYFAGRELVIGNPRTSITVDDTKFKLWKETDVDSVNKHPYAIYFTNAIGAAIKGLDRGGINLIPNSLKAVIKKRRLVSLVAAASVLMSLLAVTTAIFFIVAVSGMGFEKKNLEIRKGAVDQIVSGTRYKQLYDHISAFNNEVNALYKIDGSLFPLKPVIDDLFIRVPDGIILTSWTYSEADLSFEMDGIADSRESLLKMRKSLEESGYVGEVIAPISNYDKKKDISFQMTLKLNISILPSYAADAPRS